MKRWLGIFLISLLVFSEISLIKANMDGSRIKTDSLDFGNIKSTRPDEIVNIAQKSSVYDKKLDIQLNENDPVKFMKMKQELIDLYLPKIKKPKIPILKKNILKKIKELDPGEKLLASSRFAQVNSESVLGNDNEIIPDHFGEMGAPNNKESKSEEQTLKMVDVSAKSTYVRKGSEGGEDSFEAKNLLKDGKFWCSAGGHALRDTVEVYITLEKHNRVTGIWLQWAFAPGEFKVEISNDNDEWSDPLSGYQLSVPKGDIDWWTSVLKNPKTRWKYKSFDQRYNFEEPKWAKYIRITMRLPVNVYFGIYKIEFYAKTKSHVMLKSRMVGADTCLSTANGVITNFTPVVGLSCLQGLSYGDNRDIFIMHSNGYLTTQKRDYCVQSPNVGEINVVECGIATDYKDEREKWIFEYDGKIRSVKEQFTCLSLVDPSFGDLIPSDAMKVTVSSTQTDGLHDADKSLDLSGSTYWASNPTVAEVIFQVFFTKFPYIIKTIEIDWKFPASSFELYVLMPDGYWKMFWNEWENRETNTRITIMNMDAVGIKLKMKESTTKIGESSVYGITFLKVHSGASFLMRQPCKDRVNKENLWEIIEVGQIDEVTADEYKDAWARLRTTRTQFNIMKEFYTSIPKTIMKMKERSIALKAKLLDLLIKFEESQTKIVRFETFLKSEKLNIFTLATSPYFPANDCAHLIKAFPSKRNGMYWIKNECTPEPIKVYCDFDSFDKKAGLDYIITNNGQTINTQVNDILGFNDIRLECAKIGLEPVLIKNMKTLNNIFNLLKTLSYNLNTNAIVPVAYDYSCDYATCSKKFMSLNSEKTSDITEVLHDFNDAGSGKMELLTTNLFGGDKNSVKNVAGFGVNEKIRFEGLQNMPVIAIPCSTNNDGTKPMNSYTEVECSTNMRSNQFTGFDIYTNLRLICPRDCGVDKSSIYGSGIYTDNSSICKAAVHAGIIKDIQGGIVELVVEPGKDKYNGSSSHGVDSIDWPDKWPKSFRVNKYKPYCPIDLLTEFQQAKLHKKKKSSFLSLGESISYEDNTSNRKNDFDKNSNLDKSNPNEIKKLLGKNKEIKGHDELITNLKKFDDDKNLGEIFKNIMKFKQKINEPESHNIELEKKEHREKEHHSNDRKSIMDESLSQIKLKDMVEMIKKYEKSKKSNNHHSKNHKINNDDDDDTDKINQAHRSNSNRDPHDIPSPNDIHQNAYDTESKLKNRLNLGDSTNRASTSSRTSDSDNKVKKLVPYKVELLDVKHHSTTEEAILAITMAKKSQYHLIKALSALSASFKTLIGKTGLEIDKLQNNKETGLKSQNYVYDEIHKKLKEIIKFIYLLNKKTKQKLKRTEFKLLTIKDKIDNMMDEDEFLEEYSNVNINDNYRVYNSEKGVGKKPEWKYFLYNLQGHFKTIQQTGAFIDSGTGAHLIVKNRNFYDFELKFAVNINDNNTFGVCFRYKNPKTYYIFELSNLGKGFKRIRKFEMGIPMDIDVKNDGGYIPNTWYNIKIRAQQSVFSVYMTDQQTDIDKKYELIFKFIDNSLVHGTVAFASYGIKGLLLDNINIVHIGCTNFDKRDENGQIKYLTPTCPRFYETFTNAFIYRWKVIDPLETRDGPSIWKTYRDIDDRELILGQMSKISGLSDNEEGTIYLLQDITKNCHKGKWSVKFKALDDGLFSLVFRYTPRGDYFILEISGQKEKFVRIRKKLDGVFTLLATRPLFGYQKNNWYKIILSMNNDKINAYITLESLEDPLTKLFDEDVLDTDLKSGLVGFSTYKTRVYLDEISLEPFEDSEEIENNLYIDEEELPLPTNKFANKSILDRINSHITNFTWKKCLSYPTKEEKNRYCEITYQSHHELDRCKTNFCETCCIKNVDRNNKSNNHLCNKQCNILETGGDKNNNWNRCIQPVQANKSIYPHCEDIFRDDHFQKSRCKVDMCNLCCASFDFMGKTRLNQKALKSCYSTCIKKFDITPDKQKGVLF